MRHTTPLATMVALLAACSTSETPLGTEPADPVVPTFAITNSPGNGVVNFEEIEVCKYGSSANFSYSVFDRTLQTTLTGTFSLIDGECRALGFFDGLGADATITETGAPSGFALQRVDVDVLTRVGGVNVLTSRTESGPSVTDWVGGGLAQGGPRGVLFEFYNARQEGGEGCTPGYWKQEHHFDSWPAPYQPGDLFSTYFEDAFPGMTLLQVLSQGGGKLIALGRHTVAALLNAASGGVAYNLSVSDVINEFNAVHPSTNYGPQKDRFERFNEQGCPLN